jgi:hypothetical protein
MSRRIVRIQDALTTSTVDIVETIPEVTGILKEGATETRRIVGAGFGGVAEWLEDWEESVVDGKSMKKLERAFGLRQRARALELEEAAFNALPSPS